MNRLHPPIPLGLMVVLALAGCATGQRAPVGEERLPVRRAVHEMREELGGVVLTRRHFALDGEVRVTVAAPDSASAEAALAAGFAVADSVGRLLCLHVDCSEVGRINDAAGQEPVALSPWTEEVLATSLEWAERTGGAFDPTIAPIMDLYGFGRDPTARPDPRQLDAARRLVGWRKVLYDPQAHTVFLTEPGMRLDLRAAAKGFALDRMREAMIEAGATSGVADIEDDQLFFGPGTVGDEDLWPLEVPDPYDPTRAFARLELPTGGVSTTSPYARQVDLAGEQVGHLIDPRTGLPVRGLASLTVYAEDALTSDILSTALFILAADRGCEALREWEWPVIVVVEPPPGRRAEVCVTGELGDMLKAFERPFRPSERD